MDEQINLAELFREIYDIYPKLYNDRTSRNGEPLTIGHPALEDLKLKIKNCFSRIEKEFNLKINLKFGSGNARENFYFAITSLKQKNSKGIFLSYGLNFSEGKLEFGMGDSDGYPPPRQLVDAFLSGMSEELLPLGFNEQDKDGYRRKSYPINHLNNEELNRDLMTACRAYSDISNKYESEIEDFIQSTDESESGEDPEEAQKIFELYLPDKILRQKVINWFCDTVILANSLRSDSWSITYNTKAKDFRLTVGSIYVLWIGKKGLFISIDDKTKPKNLDTYGEHGLWDKSVEDSYFVNCEYENINLIDRDLIDSHINITRRAAQNKVHAAARKRFSRGAIEYLSKESGRELPWPKYFNLDQDENIDYWVISSGQNGEKADEFFQGNYIAISYDEYDLGSLEQYKIKEELFAKIQDNYSNKSKDRFGKDTIPSHSRKALSDFYFDVEIGDVIILKSGLHTTLGVARVTGEYYYDSSSKNYKHKRKVEWLLKGKWEHPEIKYLGKALMCYSDKQEELKKIFKIIGFDTSSIKGANMAAGKEVRSISLNQILYGPPGTGKTYNTINKSLEMLGIDVGKMKRSEIRAEYEKRVKEGRIVFTTFHQSMTYEDFIEGLKPLTPEDKDTFLEYSVVPGVFRKICDAARLKDSNFEEKIEWLKGECMQAEDKLPLVIETPGSVFSVTYRGGRTFRVKPKESKNPTVDYPVSLENIRRIYEGGKRTDVYNSTYVYGILEFLYKNGLEKYTESTGSSDKPYVLIIDEINRGNVSQIFGELITLIEEDKRQGCKEELAITLPYSKDAFTVPKNLYILGTMNTADRSVEALDTALRRRFSFHEMPPRPEVIRTEGKSNGVLAGFDLGSILKTINLRIERLLDKDHLIGHSYFIEIEFLEDLRSVFSNNIIPLLKEYFYGDYSKIGLVLGTGFIHKENNADEKIFAQFYDFDADIESRPVYIFADVKSMTDSEFKGALDKLLNKSVEN